MGRVLRDTRRLVRADQRTKCTVALAAKDTDDELWRLQLAALPQENAVRLAKPRKVDP